MQIARFGDTWAGAYEFPTAMLEDDWRLQRPGTARPSGVAGGALDLRGSAANPVAALSVDMDFVLTQTPQPTYTTVAGEAIGGLSGMLAHGNIKPGSMVVFSDSGSGYDDGNGYLFDGALALRGEINYTTGEWLIYVFDPFEQITGFGYQYRSGYTDPWVTLGTALDALRAATLARGESKLWALMRDGSHRWTWAKCVSLSAPERVGQIHHQPVRLRFYCRTGLWYSETLHSLVTDGDDTLNNAGNAIAHFTATCVCTATAATSIEIQHVFNPIESLRFQTEWTGAGTAGKSLIIDSERYRVTLDGAGVYGGLSTVYSNEWLSLLPGDNQIRVLTSSNLTSVTYTWYDTWVM